jgi:nitrogen fixation/metabolism regulation signal transduction histidine kinase
VPSRAVEPIHSQTLSFAAVQVTLRKVVRPIEELAHAADRIAAGDLSANAAPIVNSVTSSTTSSAYHFFVRGVSFSTTT